MDPHITDKTEPILVSVVISVYNGEKYILDAVRSIFNQSYRYFELIIINDGSTDRTNEILHEIRDPRIRILHNSQNLGLIASLNLGLKAAQGQFIVRLDADDIAGPDRLEKQLGFLINNPKVGVLGTDYYLIDDKGQRLPNQIIFIQNLPNLLRWQLFFRCPLAHPTVMMRRDIFDKFGGYDPAYPHAEDYELWLRISPFVQMANLPEPLVQIRVHSTNISRVHSQEQNHNSILAAQKALSSFLGKDLNFDLVHGFRNHHYIKTTDQAVQTANLLAELFSAFINQVNPSIEEQQEIQADILARMVELLVICTKEEPGKIFPIWGYLYKVNPILVFRSLPIMLKRSVKALRLRLS
jgi:glycosyltransferase involved in cell wall biosynthesis